MNTRHRSVARWLLLAGLPLLYLPLRAAEAPEPAAAEQPAEAPPASKETPPDNPGANGAKAAPPKAAPPKGAQAAEEEQISLDSNLSFPVDI
jgi:hypothetical protein